MSAKNASMDRVFVCVQCGKEFYIKSNLMRHSLVHRACIYCGKCPRNLSQHYCKQIFKTTITNNKNCHFIWTVIIIRLPQSMIGMMHTKPIKLLIYSQCAKEAELTSKMEDGKWNLLLLLDDAWYALLILFMENMTWLQTWPFPGRICGWETAKSLRWSVSCTLIYACKRDCSLTTSSQNPHCIVAMSISAS